MSMGDAIMTFWFTGWTSSVVWRTHADIYYWAAGFHYSLQWVSVLPANKLQACFSHTFIDVETQTWMNIQSRAGFADRNLVCEFILWINKPLSVVTKCVVRCVQLIRQADLGSCNFNWKLWLGSGMSLATLNDSHWTFLRRVAHCSGSLCIFRPFLQQRD